MLVNIDTGTQLLFDELDVSKLLLDVKIILAKFVVPKV